MIKRFILPIKIIKPFRFINTNLVKTITNQIMPNDKFLDKIYNMKSDDFKVEILDKIYDSKLDEFKIMFDNNKDICKLPRNIVLCNET